MENDPEITDTGTTQHLVSTMPMLDFNIKSEEREVNFKASCQVLKIRKVEKNGNFTLMTQCN